MRTQSVLFALATLASGSTAAMAQIFNPETGHAYLLVGPGSWTECEAIARSIGGDLVTIETQTENDWLLSTFKDQCPPCHGVWIGYNDYAEEGNWVWSSGIDSGFTHWNVNQPDGGPTENAGEMLLNHPSRRDGFWNDLFDAGRPNYGIAELPGAFLRIDTPAIDLALRQDERLTISWLDDGQYGTTINLYFDPDTSPEPWEGVSNHTRIAVGIDASDPDDAVSWEFANNLQPGTYSVWGDANNGVDPPTYSRAPGLVTVTEFTDDTEPIIDQDRIDLGVLPSPTFIIQAPTPTNLYLVTHGWNGLFGTADHSWIQHTAEAVAAHAGASEEWDVAYYEWGFLAGLPGSPAEVAVSNGTILGFLIAADIRAAGYTHVEVVAHSAGSWLASAIATGLFGDTTVNLTLLDAYVSVPPDYNKLILGVAADHVFNCYDTGISDLTFLTHENLLHAFNVDMTCRRTGQEPDRNLDGEPDPYKGTPHGAPWAWYRRSVWDANGTFMDDDSYSAPLGFKMSKAYSGDNSGWDATMSRYPANGGDEFNVCGGLWDGCDGDTTVFMEYLDVFDFTAMDHTVGPDGTVTLEPNSVELATGAEYAWIGIDVPVTRAVSAVLFDVEFTSDDPEAEGYATGYWNGVQLTSADERFIDGSDPGMRGFTFMETIAPGQKVISFRLDNNGGPTSSVLISNLRTGINLDVDINGDCVATVDDLCAWAAEPYDLDGNGIVDADDRTILATALGVSGADTDGDGIPDVCEVCAPDLNGDGLVNTQDFLAFLNLWVAGDPIADWNDDGAINTQDFLAYLNDWAAGC